MRSAWDSIRHCELAVRIGDQDAAAIKKPRRSNHRAVQRLGEEFAGCIAPRSPWIRLVRPSFSMAAPNYSSASSGDSRVGVGSVHAGYAIGEESREQHAIYMRDGHGHLVIDALSFAPRMSSGAKLSCARELRTHLPPPQRPDGRAHEDASAASRRRLASS